LIAVGKLLMKQVADQRLADRKSASLGRPPLRKEVVAWVEKGAGAEFSWVEKETGVKFTPRQWRRVFLDLAELFE
jgi:hypothetical protein